MMAVVAILNSGIIKRIYINCEGKKIIRKSSSFYLGG